MREMENKNVAQEDDEDEDGDEGEDEDGLGKGAVSLLRVELSAKQKEVDHLVEDVRRPADDSGQSERTRVDEAADLAEKLKAAEAEVEDARRQMESRSDYDEIKRELHILKSMECGNCDDFDEKGEIKSEQTESRQDQQQPRQQQSLEYLLLARNRALMNENTQNKLALTQERDKSTKLDQDNVGLQGQVEELKALVAQLEQHLLQVKTVAVDGNDVLDVASAILPVRLEAEGSASPPLPVSSSSSSHVLDGGVSGGDVAIDVEALESSSSANQFQRSVSSSVEDDVASLGQQQQQPNRDDSLLAIVSSQRERFRQRNQDLEAENIAHKNRIQSLQDDLDVLRNDNLKLYEKIKFLQSNYSTSSSSSSAGGVSLVALSPAGHQLDSRYASQYEQSLDPFQAFARKERSRKYAAMRPYEKATLALVRFILGSPLSRTFAFFYFIFLHLLVFLVLYRFSVLQDCHQDSREDCAKQFADHMLHVHGGGAHA